MKYKDLAIAILSNVGGEKNVQAIEHCATRLRFNLKDDTQAKTDAIKALQGVVSVINKGGQYQVVIGNEVIEVYNEIIKLGEFQSSELVEGEKKSIINKVLDTISGIFFPIVPALAGAGMIKAILSLLSVMNVLSVTSPTYQFLNFMGDACFYFLPVIIASSAAKKFHVNAYVAMSIGAILIHPTFVSMIATAKEAGTTLSFIGLPVSLVTYSSSVIPIILAIWFMSYVEPFINKYTPKSLRIFMAPLITLLIVGVTTLILIGPFGNLCGQVLGSIINTMNQYVSWLVPFLVGAFTPLMVMTGMHYGLIPIGINMLATTGFDTVAGPGMMVSNIAQGGASLGVALKSKQVDIKSLATSAGISAVCGISEPAMYGISLRFKKPLYAAMIGGGCAGLFIGIMGVGRYAQVAPGLFALPSYIGGDGMNNFIYAAIGCAIAFVVSFIASYLLGIDEQEEIKNIDETKNCTIEDEEIYAPVMGKLVPMKDVEDPVFAQQALGKGVAISPSEGKIYAPVDGIVSVFFDTGHAIGITSTKGAEVLIHVGIDTVALKGKHFSPQVKQGAHVKKGDLLLVFDMEAIQQEGYSVITPIMITNTSRYASVDVVEGELVQVGSELLVTTV